MGGAASKETDTEPTSTTGDFTVQPDALIFRPPFNPVEISEYLKLTNTFSRPVVFKVKITAYHTPHYPSLRYFVLQDSGIVHPDESVEVEINLSGMGDVPPMDKCRDSITFLYHPISPRQVKYLTDYGITEKMAAKEIMAGEGELRAIEIPVKFFGARGAEHLTDTDVLCWWLLNLGLHIEPPAVEHGHISVNPLSLIDVSPRIYSRLESWQIRIICVEPGKYGQPVNIQLKPAALHSSGAVFADNSGIAQYDAVSYSWGYPALSCTIKCNGQDFPVNPSVMQAIQQLRLTAKRRFLWIDAICINQMDLKEKSLQIQNMFSIFKQATNVIVWLGQIESKAEALAIRAYANIGYGIPMSDVDPPCPGCFTEIYKGLTTIASRPWFTRTWVRQEVFAARNIHIQIGDNLLDWKAAEPIRRMAHRVGVQAGSSSSPYNPGPRQASPGELGICGGRDHRRFRAMRSEWAQDVSMPLFDNTPKECDLFTVLSDNGRYNATDPRDFIYGILGMTNTDILTDNNNESGEPNRLQVDYTRSVSEVFGDAARYLIVRDRTLDCLIIAWLCRPEDGLSLPSWTPDWRRGFNPDILEMMLSDHIIPDDIAMETSDLTDTTILRVHGFVYSTIYRKSTGELLPQYHKYRLTSAAVLADPIECAKNPQVHEAVNLGGELVRPSFSAYVPDEVETGDIVVVLIGSRMPLVLRPTGYEQYKLVGPVVRQGRYLQDHFTVPDFTMLGKNHPWKGYFHEPLLADRNIFLTIMVSGVRDFCIV